MSQTRASRKGANKGEGNLIMKRPLSENGVSKSTQLLDGRLHQPKSSIALPALLSGHRLLQGPPRTPANATDQPTGVGLKVSGLDLVNEVIR